jgi:hypothetical protein
MKSTYLISLCVLFFLGACQSSGNKDLLIQSAELDSIELANTQSVLDAGFNITKAYISPADSSFFLMANMRADHRMIGYEKPDTLSKGLILFSVFTNDVENNPFNYPLGAYYDSYSLNKLALKYVGHTDNYYQIEATDSNLQISELYFDKKWVAFENEDLNNTLSDDVLEEFGKITAVVDGSYPFFIVSINFEKRDFSIDFDLNIEAIDMNMEQLYACIGKYARIYYISEMENNLTDLQLNNTSLFGEYTQDYDPEWNTFSGILSGANTITTGDLPSTITITNQSSDALQFELFIDKEVRKANNKLVTAFYSIDISNEIVELTVVEN